MAAVAYVNPLGLTSSRSSFLDRSIGPHRNRQRVVASLESQALRPRRLSSATYRRRRLGFALLATTALLVVGLMLGRLGAGPLAGPEIARSSSNGAVLIAQRDYVVLAGETDWSIARQIQPTGDIRPLVDFLYRQHAGRALQIGEVLQLP